MLQGVHVAHPASCLALLSPATPPTVPLSLALLPAAAPPPTPCFPHGQTVDANVHGRLCTATRATDPPRFAAPASVPARIGRDARQLHDGAGEVEDTVALRTPVRVNTCRADSG